VALQIREVKADEYEGAGRITASAWSEFLPAEPHPEWESFLAEVADIRGRADRTVVLGAFEDGRPLGTVTIELDQKIHDDAIPLPPDVANVRMLGVSPAARRRGVGQALMKAGIAEARARGKRAVTLTYDPTSLAARSLYARLGFEETGEIEGHEVIARLLL
jgi:ribosomal protein S18 acetylase RimI-like enzyme